MGQSRPMATPNRSSGYPGNSAHPAKRGPRSIAGSILPCLVGERISVELKSDLVLTGVLDEVDIHMNIFLGDAEQHWLEGRLRGQRVAKLEYVFLSSRMIRMIHIPETINLDSQMRLFHDRKRQGKYKRQALVK